jgi:hypothetical protein
MLTREELAIRVAVEDKIVKLNDARKVFGGCIPGWGIFCEQYHLDWATVVKNGLKSSYLLSLDDDLAHTLVNYMYTIKDSNG